MPLSVHVRPGTRRSAEATKRCAVAAARLRSRTEAETLPRRAPVSGVTPRSGVECSASASEWLPQLSAAIEAATGRSPQVRGVPFGTDAGPLSATGIPCVVFGPGDIAQAHTKDEWIDLDQVALAAEAYFRIAVELDQG